MPKIEVMTGNEAAAWGAKLARVKVVSAYPITPQTVIVEKLAKFIADGELEAEYVEAEGEHGMLGVCIGASATGVRTFTSTSSQGFAFGYENMTYAPGLRLPIVMTVVNRAYANPWSIWADYTDAMSGKDQGWIQFYCENNQEVLDTMVQAYRVAEDKRVLMPIMVCLAGFYVSHTAEPVVIPDQETVDKYLPPYRPEHIVLDPRNPMSQASFSPEECMAFELAQEKALARGKEVITEADEEFGRLFGRRYGGLLEMYRCEGAEAVILTMGSIARTARTAVDELHREGKPVGLVKLRVFRPFPKERLREVAEGFKAMAVVDRCLMHGTGEGALFSDVKSALYNAKDRPLLAGFVTGLHGTDVLVEDFKYMAEKALEAARSGIAGEVETVPIADIVEKTLQPIPLEKYPDLCYPGTRGCPGCSMPLAFRHIVDTIGENIVVIRAGGCGSWVDGDRGKAILRIPMLNSVLPGGGATVTGVSRALRAKGLKDVYAVCIAGDGSTGDMGFQAFSGAMERNEDVIYVCLDNEAYMNTGIQRAGTTPFGAWTTTTEVGKRGTGKTQQKKDLPMIVAAHKVPYLATASLAHMTDFKKKVEKAKRIKGFRYIHVLTPCPTGWRFPTEKVVAVARLAVETAMWPLYEMENGGLRMTYRPKERLPISEYTKIQGRFRHTTPEQVKTLQENVDKTWSELESMEQQRVT